ncbi:multidrug transporter subunit MdtC, partial [bacterium]|nr:multidrug transporter subunit MdtC [bacterium]
MYLLGFSLNNLSLMALTIATGFIIDDAVVVVENIIRHLERHESPVQAALKGSQEVGFTIFCISLSLVAVFVPILLMPGIVGRLINEFAVTLVVAILTSMLISLTITPMLCAFFLKNINVVAVDKNNLYLFYEKSLLWVINHPNLMVLLTIIVIVLNVFLFKIIPKGIFPTQDTGRITGLIQGRQNIPFHEMKNLLKNYVDIILSDDGVDSVVAFAGGGTRTLNQGNLYIGLKPLSERKISSETIINRLRKELKAVGDGHLYLQSAQDLSIGSRVGAAQYQYTLRAFDLNTLQSAESSLFNKLGKIPGVLDLNTDQLKNGTQIYTAIDRDRAATLGVNVATIDRALYDAFGQRKVSTNYYKNNQYNVVMEVDPAFSADEDMMNYLYVKSMFGSLVP